VGPNIPCTRKRFRPCRCTVHLVLVPSPAVAFLTDTRGGVALSGPLLAGLAHVRGGSAADCSGGRTYTAHVRRRRVRPVCSSKVVSVMGQGKAVAGEQPTYVRTRTAGKVRADARSRSFLQVFAYFCPRYAYTVSGHHDPKYKTHSFFASAIDKWFNIYFFYLLQQ
jgi:hypothetical protein